MPIDYSLPYRLLQQQPDIDPMRIVGNTLAIRRQVLADQEAERQGEVRARELGDASRIREILSTNQGDLKAALPGIMPLSPKLGMDIEKHLDERGQAGAELSETKAKATKEELAGLLSKLQVASRLVSGMTEETFGDTKAAVQAIVGPDLAGYLGDSFSEARKQAAIRWGMSAAEQARAEHDALTAELTESRDRATERDRAADNIETNRHNQEMEKSARARAANTGRSTPTAYDRYLSRVARGLGKRVDDLTDAEEIAAKTAWEKTDFGGGGRGRPDGDIYWDRDRAEYSDYVRRQERASETDPTVSVDDFVTWRSRTKKRGEDSAPPSVGARPMSAPPQAGRPQTGSAGAGVRDPKTLVGKTVRLKDGRTVKVKAVKPDGSLVIE